jgi:hypothetical protein
MAAPMAVLSAPTEQAEVPVNPNFDAETHAMMVKGTTYAQVRKANAEAFAQVGSYDYYVPQANESVACVSPSDKAYDVMLSQMEPAISVTINSYADNPVTASTTLNNSTPNGAKQIPATHKIFNRMVNQLDAVNQISAIHIGYDGPLLKFSKTIHLK